MGKKQVLLYVFTTNMQQPIVAISLFTEYIKEEMRYL